MKLPTTLVTFLTKLRRGTATDGDFVDADKRAFLVGMTATVAGLVVAPTVILPAVRKVSVSTYPVEGQFLMHPEVIGPVEIYSRDDLPKDPETGEIYLARNTTYVVMKDLNFSGLFRGPK